MSIVETLAKLLGGSALQVDTDRSHVSSPSPFQHTMNPLKWLPILTSVALFACGNHSVDLDSSRVPTLTASADPDELGVIDEQVQNLAVDGQRLYWVGVWAYTSGNYYGVRAALRSCEKAKCASTLVTYENGALELSFFFSVQNGQVYWVHHVDQKSTAWELLRCPVTGCETAHRVASRDTDRPAVAAFDASAFYFFSSAEPGYAVPPGSAVAAGLYRDSLAETDGTPQLIHASERPYAPRALQVSGDYLYWIEDQTSAPNGAVVQRMRSDGSQPPEPLANDPAPNASTGQMPLTLAVNADSVFWTRRSLRGSIVRCPITGCPDPNTPDVFLAPVRLPEALLLDDTRLYWQNQTATMKYGVSSCSLTHCTSPDALISNIDVVDTLAIDDDYVYTATSTDNAPDSSFQPYVTTAHIRRVAKGPK